ncbi:unnamed protein product, partial [Ectocarpus fasciculatus]
MIKSDPHRLRLALQALPSARDGPGRSPLRLRQQRQQQHIGHHLGSRFVRAARAAVGMAAAQATRIPRVTRARPPVEPAA